MMALLVGPLYVGRMMGFRGVTHKRYTDVALKTEVCSSGCFLSAASATAVALALTQLSAATQCYGEVADGFYCEITFVNLIP